MQKMIGFCFIILFILGCNDKSKNDVELNLLSQVFKSIKYNNLDIFPPGKKNQMEFAICNQKIFVFKYINYNNHRIELGLQDIPDDIFPDREIEMIENYTDNESNKFLEFSKKGHCGLVIQKIYETDNNSIIAQYLLFSGPKFFNSHELIFKRNGDKYEFKEHREINQY